MPYSGSITKVEFKTVTGQAILIKTSFNDNEDIPMGANVINQKGESIGMVGQGSLIYARIRENEGTLRVNWTDSDSEKNECSIHYVIDDDNSDIIRLILPCMSE